MKLTQKEVDEFKKIYGDQDWESFHAFYDDLIKERLKQLDPEFLDSLEEATKGGKFWYA